MTADLDLERLPYEISRALDAAMVLLEGVEPGLYVKPDEAADAIDVYQRDGTYLCSVPRYRLRRPEPWLLSKCAEKALENFPLHIADQVVAAIHDGAITVYEPEDEDVVRVEAHVGELTYLLYTAHRAVVVEGWPDTDAAA